MGYSCVLFDLDHTLFDSDASERDAYSGAVGGAGVDDPSSIFERYVEINRGLWRQLEAGTIDLERLRVQRFEDLAEHAGIEYDAALVADHYSELLGSCGQLYEGSRPLLDQLRGQVQLGLVTNGVSSTQRARLARTGIADVFDAVVVSGEFGSAKPGRAIFEEVFRQLGEPTRAEVLMVGDSLSSDIAGAAAAGVDSCWFNPLGVVADAELFTHQVSSLGDVALLALG
ncbi:MAG: YjjG family noncanonical pyrimidine nucleotidase [Actinomycetota bacterium]|jgi:YjjG family noncanonical pyrimidine nucleotidase|nr:YjjG family noncanonical pyrimidine nucleotidase [Actinomycetota bacterium]